MLRKKVDGPSLGSKLEEDEKNSNEIVRHVIMLRVIHSN